MPKRFSNLIPLIIERHNMVRAFDTVVSQLHDEPRVFFNHGQRIDLQGRRTAYRAHLEPIIDRLSREIADGSFRVRGYREMLVTDGPKVRLVQSPCVTDRIACNAIMAVVERKIYPSVIPTSAASIPGRGMHRLFRKMRSDIGHDPAGTRYFYKCDIRKFFESIDQQVMWQTVQHYIKDPVLLPILHSFVTMMPQGLSIGLRSSQCYGNIILSPLDHHLKDTLGIRYYYRYCDDIVVLGPDKPYLWHVRDIVHQQVARLGLAVKDNESVRPITEGIDFLGYIYDGNQARLRKRTKQKAARRLATVRSRKRRQEVIGSFKGMAKWADAKHLYKKITHKNMIKFSEMKSRRTQEGIAYLGKDGKRILQGDLETLGHIVNTHITILDFEVDVPTRNGPRYLVQFQKDDGTICKYLTNDSEQKFWLNDARKNGNFPFECTIVMERFGQGKVRYKFN